MGYVNPPLLLCDTDVVIQLFKGRSLEPFKCLRERFRVQATVVPEVAAELQSNPNSDVARAYRIAIGNGLLQELTQGTIRDMRDWLPDALSEESPRAVWERIQQLGDEYNLRVDLGESYTYAAALTLDVPTTSNDGTAIRTLQDNGIPVPVPVLRAFDLLALAVQTGYLTHEAAHEIRKKLEKANENVPRVFRNGSFQQGLRAFAPRLVDPTCACDVALAPNAIHLTPV